MQSAFLTKLTMSEAGSKAVPVTPMSGSNCLVFIHVYTLAYSRNYVIFSVGFTMCTAQMVSGVTHGRIVSPNFPFHYPDNVQCDLTLSISRSSRVDLVVRSFKLETCCDKLWIRSEDGINRQITRREPGFVFTCKSTLPDGRTEAL